MHMSVFEIIVLIGPTVLLVIGYEFFKKKSVRVFAVLWFALFSVLFTIGWLDWNAKKEITQLGSALIPSASVLLNGAFLLWAIKREKSRLFVFSIAVILSVVSLVLCLFLLAVTNQIWGL